MFRIRIIGTLIAIAAVLTSLLIQFSSLSPAQLSAAQSGSQKAVAGKETAGEAPLGEDLKTVDASDIVVKEHHWVEDGYWVRWTPDGKYVVFGREFVFVPEFGPGDGFYVMDPLCKDVRPVGKGMYFVGMSPDGKTLYGSLMIEGRFDRKGLFAINVESGSVRQITDIESMCNLSPDAKYALFAPKSNEDPYPNIVNVESGSVKQIADIVHFWSSDWSPNRKYVLLRVKSGGRVVVNADGIIVFKVLEDDVSWSPDSSRLLCRSKDGSAYVMDVDSGAIIAKGKWNGWVGKTNKVWTRDEVTKDIQLMNVDGTEVKTITGSSSWQEFQFSPSGDRVIYVDPADDCYAMLRITDGKKVKSTLKSARYWDVTWLPGEECIVRARQYYLLSLNTSGNKSAERLLGDEEGSWQPYVSPDSRFIALAMGKPMRLGIANIDGTNPNILTETYTDGGIVWSPSGNAIAYSRKGQSYPPSFQRVGVVILGRKKP